MDDGTAYAVISLLLFLFGVMVALYGFIVKTLIERYGSDSVKQFLLQDKGE